MIPIGRHFRIATRIARYAAQHDNRIGRDNRTSRPGFAAKIALGNEYFEPFNRDRLNALMDAAARIYVSNLDPARSAY